MRPFKSLFDARVRPALGRLYAVASAQIDLAGRASEFPRAAMTDRFFRQGMRPDEETLITALDVASNWDANTSRLRSTAICGR